ncbi:TonB-dependent receptor [Sphingomonas sp. AOB5]|uniref:TonB-dependent receptor n=1 Tax=Sphingomonas sp. AOB5 TaxID=3034017 RepID=UPI0023F80463|nr:TonB-dependent receptor [Sphingomonas sp. AOB5]MDF7775290.1 TonB-dependent receptor [Sphingomonas sp. AOB5]
MNSRNPSATRRSPRLRAAMLAGSCIALLGATSALAQDAQEESQEGNAEIVVTAQKRAQNAQDVPIAITALGGDDLASAGVSDTEDLKAAVPSLNVTTAVGGFGLPRIRGIGATGQGPGIENPVAIYVDGVYYGAAFGVLQSLFDVDQVAVLKGPQGTLFGRNATGGLIQIATQDPKFEWGGKAQFGYGNYETLNGAFFVTGGLSSNIAISVSGQYEKREEGFAKNLFTGNDVGQGDGWSGRAKLLWEPGATTRVVLSGDFNGRDAAEPAFRQFSRNALGVMLAGSERDIVADVDPLLRARQWGTSLTITQDLGSAELKSITAYRRSTLRTLFDPDGTTQPRIRVDNNNYDTQFTQEINLVSQGDGALKWVIGAFYMDNDAGQDPGRTTGLFTFGNNGYSDDIYSVRVKSISGFAELTYALGDATNVIAGIRYTSDDRSFESYQVDFNGNTNTTTRSATITGQKTFGNTSWRLSVDHRFSPQLLAYASYNRGFRGGTYNPRGSLTSILQPETVDAFEVGFKSDLADRTLRLNVAAYYYDQDAVQVQQVIAGRNNVYNANGAEIYGVDADITWQPTRNVRIFGGVGYTHAQYKDFPQAVISYPYPLATGFVIPTGQTCLGTNGNPFTQLGGNCLLIGDRSGAELQNTPKLTLSLGGNVDIPTGIGTFSVAGNYYYNDGFVGSPDGRVRQPSYNLVDASLTWKPNDGSIYVRVWGKNLTDDFYRTQLSATNAGDNGTAGNPRTYGATFGFEF